jgi:hypothetical protein
MTCIVGLVHDGKVLIGGDSAGVSGYDLRVRADLKVWSKDGWAFGFTSSFRMGQLLRYSLAIPQRHPDTDLMQFMVTSFVDAVRSCLKLGGYASLKDSVEEGGTFLIGHAGRLFSIESDYQVSEESNGFSACGCGHAYACGSMYSNSHMEPEARVQQALDAAEAMCAGVRGPFSVVSA